MEKFLKLNKKDLKEIDANIKRNYEDRMRYIDQYVEWLKKTPNKEWSTQQNKVIAQK